VVCTGYNPSRCRRRRRRQEVALFVVVVVRRGPIDSATGDHRVGFLGLLLEEPREQEPEAETASDICRKHLYGPGRVADRRFGTRRRLPNGFRRKTLGGFMVRSDRMY